MIQIRPDEGEKMAIRDILAANPDLIEISKKFSAEQVRKYKEEQRAKKAAEAASQKTVKPEPKPVEKERKKEKA
jgi:hypothetical protein